MARPPGGLGQVDRLSGPERLKHRLRVILETVVGHRSIADACRELGCSEARFHVLRRQTLEGALHGLAPRRRGRPPKPPPADPCRVERLERELEELRDDLWRAELREEIAMTMPQLLHRGKKIGRRRAKEKRRRSRSKTPEASAEDR